MPAPQPVRQMPASRVTERHDAAKLQWIGRRERTHVVRGPRDIQKCARPAPRPAAERAAATYLR